MKRIRLTALMLSAISDMANMIEAGGEAMIQGLDGAQRKKAFKAAMDAGAWARQELARRRRMGTP
jgi:hypothetical protein